MNAAGARNVERRAGREGDRMAGMAVEITRADVERFLGAWILQAQRDAQLVARVLEGMGIIPKIGRRMKRPVVLPRLFLLELAAAIRIALWERMGTAEAALAELPSSHDALEYVCTAVLDQLAAGSHAEPEPRLSRQVMIVWLRHFALNGLNDLGVDVVFSGTCPPDALELIADFLWRFRHLARERN
jgi:hypothetical protein